MEITLLNAPRLHHATNQMARCNGVQPEWAYKAEVKDLATAEAALSALSEEELLMLVGGDEERCTVVLARHRGLGEVHRILDEVFNSW